MTSGPQPIPEPPLSDAHTQDSSPNIRDLLSSAILHQQEGRPAEAQALYRQILAIDPQHADSLHLLGVIEYQSGHLNAAADLIRSAIAINRTGAYYYSNLGIVLHAQGQLDEAAIRYRQALVLKPNLAEVHLNLGNILKIQGDLTESFACYRQALSLKPDCAEACNNLGTLHQLQDHMDDAIASYRQALAMRPDYAEAHNNLGTVYQSQDRLDDAIACYQQALTINPEYAKAFYNLGRALTAQGHPDQALAHYKQALVLDPDYGQAAFSESLTQLLLGDFTVGWPNFENRWRSVDHKTPMRNYPHPLWTGEAITSGHLLLWGEQGVGDEILFAGLIPDVIRSNTPCVLECDPRLQPLFARSFPSIEVISGYEPTSDPELEIAAHLPTGSLPRLFRPTIAAFASTTSPFLFADSIQRDDLRARYDDGSLLIGLAWQTNNQNTGRNRSMDLSLFAPLFAIPGIRWISLQYGDPAELEAQAISAHAPLVIDLAVDQLASIDDFAAQIAALDMVITIDNSTAHLAAALGLPTWVLLPFVPDWRWLLHRDDSPWYPTVRLFRQQSLSDWQSVIENVARALSLTIAAKPTNSKPTRHRSHSSGS